MIDREKVNKEFEHLLNAARGNYFYFVDLPVDEGEEILALLKEQEKQIDTQRRNLMILLNEPRIVRCKDCEHATITTDGEYCKYCENYTDENGDPIEVYHSANWFCADGRKRDE